MCAMNAITTVVAKPRVLYVGPTCPWRRSLGLSSMGRCLGFRALGMPQSACRADDRCQEKKGMVNTTMPINL
jgi:hypothetical protein